MNTLQLAENGILPNWLIRMGIRMRVQRKLELVKEGGIKQQKDLVLELRKSPIAVSTEDANEQHYEVPTSFYRYILGPAMKYSACYWPEGVTSLQEAEVASLELVSDRAQLTNGQKIMELGCGWGSFSLWAAEKFPKSEFLAVSNSTTQAEYIRDQSKKRGIKNLKVVTENMVKFDPQQSFDRIVSIEMFEHMRNYEKFFERISNWLKDDGKLFVHVFSHKEYGFLYENSDESDWMSNYFFTGGVMPSHDLFSNFSDDIQIEKDWRLNGKHYSKTLESWLTLLNQNHPKVLSIFSEHYGAQDAEMWVNRWKMFILACSEMFAFKNGNEWGISHYRFTKSDQKTDGS